MPGFDSLAGTIDEYFKIYQMLKVYPGNASKEQLKEIREYLINEVDNGNTAQAAMQELYNKTRNKLIADLLNILHDIESGQ